MGVVTGIPMEFQFGTNWSRFSRFSGEVVGQALAMEGVFAFFLESTFLGLFLFGERRLGPRRHLAAAVALALGSWLSGYFIIVANAFMQHPVGYRLGEDGVLHLESFSAYIFNPWALWQFAHNMAASLVTASFVVAAVGAYWSLMGQHARHAAICLRAGVIAGLASSLLVAFPTGDGAGKMVTRHQPVTLAAMEGLFEGGPVRRARDHRPARRRRPPAGEPDRRALDPELPGLRVLREHRSRAERLPEGPVAAQRGAALLQLPHHGRARHALHPDDGDRIVPAAAGRLATTRPMLWVLMLAFPFPYIATTAGWWTAELGRQPWIIYGLMRTADAHSELVNPGDVVFTLLGFAGLYLLLGMLFVVQVLKEINRGPAASH